MGDIGKEEREVEVLPAEDPWAAPDAEPAPQTPTPAREPAEAPS
jgi:hypothetical protein